ncbi:DUF418 domain-containing protein [Catenuloplanes japonicus]|uniref:DUF418 domain-containing protein n=1 Tax=Catenuloplanes japonicus TaxID=33876 RepID=UPI0018DBF33C|nr:DUF418 domain-containing protein [Catenuloplanes japonicus]
MKPIAHNGSVSEGAGTVLPPSGDGLGWLHLLVDQRFYPIFAVLFGAGFTLLLRSAGSRPVLVRRLAALLAIGLLHLTLLWPGDVLTAYAIFGLLVLLPATWLPRGVAAGLCALLIAGPLVLATGFYLLIPGLLMLGAVLTRYGVADRLDDLPPRVPALLFTAFAAAAVPLVWWQTTGIGFRWAYPLAGLAIAGAYVCGLLALLATRARGVLAPTFAPLGRMALTNYLGATVLVLIVSALAPGPSDAWGTGTVLGIAAAILALQWLWSRAWLLFFRQGPLEWGWRWVTWWRRPPLVREHA